MLRERIFSDRSNYPKLPSETSTPIDNIEWFAKNKGITNLDDTSVKVRTIIDDVNESELARHKAKKAREAKARSEYIDALLNLDDGTAVLRQKKDRTPALSKAVKTKTVRPAAAPKRKYAKRGENKTTFDGSAAIERRAAMIKTLKSGGKIEHKPQRKCKGGYTEYQLQYTDIRWIVRTKGLAVTRIQRVGTNTSYFVLDNLTRYQMSEVISGFAEEKDKMLMALLSKQLVLASGIESTAKVAARTIAALVATHDLDIYTVFDSRSTKGWIFIMNEEKRKAKINDLGDMLQAIDILKERKAKVSE